MGVLLQAFYENCPQQENQECNWWNYLKKLIPAISKAGFTAIWLPPPGKGLYYKSMGYNVFDYFDLGEFDQKGNTATWFGTKKQLQQLISVIHKNKMSAYADLVLNHNSGGDSEKNPLTGIDNWTKFNPASGKFFRDWQCFHPNYYHPLDNDKDEGVFGEMPDLCHANDYVRAWLQTYAKWLVEEIGYDGFRYDYVKGFAAVVIKEIQEADYKKGQDFKPFGVGEFWDEESNIIFWLDSINNDSENPVSAFDFPLRNRLKSLCDDNSFNIEELRNGSVLLTDKPLNAVTFVDNHDTNQSSGGEITNDKMLAYAYILTHEGYPCVFWKDYYNYGLAKPDSPNGINALIAVHEKFAAGKTLIHHAKENLYIMQRSGNDKQKGLIFVLNISSDAWHEHIINTGLVNQEFLPVAWSGKDKPDNKTSEGNGSVEFGAEPRGYTVYIMN